MKPQVQIQKNGYVLIVAAILILMCSNIETLRTDTKQDAIQDAQLLKHWKLHGWARHQITELQYKAGIPIKDWPDLD